MQETIENVQLDFDLPCHDNELSKANDTYQNLKLIFNDYQKQKKISDKQFIKLFEDVIRVLDYVGRLSMSVFEKDEEIEEHFKMEYLNSPELGKELWLKYAHKLHHPYNIQKNRCHKLLEELDELYVALYAKQPPNWKI